MHDRVDDVGGLVVGGLDDEGEPLGVGGDEGGEVGDDRQGREVARVRDLEGAQEGGKTLGAEPQRLPLDANLAGHVCKYVNSLANHAG